MKRYNKIEKTFGHMAFSAIILFLAVLSAFFYGLCGFIYNFFHGFNAKIDFWDTIIIFAIFIFILLFLAFFAFTTTCTKIDYENRRIKYTTLLCGIFSIGKWTYLMPNMKLGLKETTERWGAYGRGGTSTSLDYTNLKIMLYDAEDTEIIPVKKVKKAKNAESELEKLSKLLNLEIIK